MNGWVVLGYLSAGLAGAITFLRVIALELSNDDRELSRQERMLRFEFEMAREKKEPKEEPEESMEPILVQPFRKGVEPNMN